MKEKEKSAKEKYREWILKFSRQREISVEEAEKMEISKIVKRDFLGSSPLEMDGRQ